MMKRNILDVVLDTRLIGVILLVLSIGMGWYGYTKVHGSEVDILTFLEDYYANVSSELASIAVTVIIIDALQRRRDKSQSDFDERDRLFRDLRSGIRDMSVRAYRELLERRWLHNGFCGAQNCTMQNLKVVT